MFISDIKKLKDFIILEEPICFIGFEAIGYFPYEKAQLNQECVCSPRNVFAEIERILHNRGVMDNKIVVVFKDLRNFGTDDFAIQFKDAYCKMGKLEQIMGYACRTLELKKSA